MRYFKRMLINSKPVCDRCGTGVGWTQAVLQATKKQLLCFSCQVSKRLWG